MQVRKTRWSKVYESSEEELVDFLAARNVQAVRWTVDEFESVPERTLDGNTNLWLAEGSASFTANGKTYSMQPGDVIYLPIGATVSVIAGMSGCVCYESAAQSPNAAL